MTGLVLLLRPEPGAAESADRARRLGLDPVTAPLFTIAPAAWEAPDPRGFDAVLLTSANAARHGRPQLARFLDLPCYAVGDATAEAAERAGFRRVFAGSSDGAGAVAAMAGAGVQRAIHLCGRDHLPLRHPSVAIDRRIVYVADAVKVLPEAARAALAQGALALVHSPRAGALFGTLVDAAGLDRAAIVLAAISPAAAAAVGPGWRRAATAARPRDEALLELAAELCKTAPEAE